MRRSRTARNTSTNPTAVGNRALQRCYPKAVHMPTGALLESKTDLLREVAVGLPGVVLSRTRDSSG